MQVHNDATISSICGSEKANNVRLVVAVILISAQKLKLKNELDSDDLFDCILVKLLVRSR